jgi:hypothetical protein
MICMNFRMVRYCAGADGSLFVDLPDCSRPSAPQDR